MKRKFSPHPGFWHLFFSIPLLAGIALLFMILGLAPFGGEMTASFSGLSADVFPNPDQIPDGLLPSGKIESDFLAAFINIMFALMSTVVLGALLTSACLYIIHFGNEEQLKTAKGLWKWGIVGVLIMIVAYTIVQGVTRLTFTNA